MFRSLLFNIAKRIATDPRVQEKASSTFEQDVKPVLKNVADRAKSNIKFAAGEIKETARQSSPLEEPGNFLQKVRERLLDHEEEQRDEPPEDHTK